MADPIFQLHFILLSPNYASNLNQSKILSFGKEFTLSQTTILDTSKLTEFADDNFKFDENGRKFSKQVENAVGKGEIARYEQFLLFPQCFQRLVLQTRKNRGLFGKGLRELIMVIVKGFLSFLHSPS